MAIICVVVASLSFACLCHSGLIRLSGKVTVQLVGSGVWRGVRRVASLVRGLEVEYSGHAAVA